MASNDAESAIQQIIDGIKSLAPLGANSVHRRSLAIAEAELSRVKGEEITIRCRPERPIPVGDDDNSFSFHDAYYEHAQDDRRRTILLNPVEALATHFIDFYTNRVEALEFRRLGKPSDDVIAAAEKLALSYLANTSSLVSALTIASQDKTEIIKSLRGLAHRLENTNLEQTRSFPEIAVLGREVCQLIRTDAGPTRWVDNSKKLEQQFTDVYRCSDSDSCCGNDAYTKVGAPRWEVVWVDDGNVMHPPPVTPDNFVQYPWENRCRVLPSVVRANVTSDWGWRNLNASTDFHGGIDIGVPVGTQVLNAVAGTVAWIKRQGANGETGVVVRTGNQLRTYWHVDPDIGLRDDAQIVAGAVLGTTANRTGPHLHFALHVPPSPEVDLRSDAYSQDPCP